MISVEEEKRLLVPMSREQHKRGKQEKGSDGAEKVIVAVKASKEIPKTALVVVWSLTHVVQPGDCITLLVVVPSQSSGMPSFRSFFYTRYFSLNQLDPILLSWILFCLPI